MVMVTVTVTVIENEIEYEMLIVGLALMGQFENAGQGFEDDERRRASAWSEQGQILVKKI